MARNQLHITYLVTWLDKPQGGLSRMMSSQNDVRFAASNSVVLHTVANDNYKRSFLYRALKTRLKTRVALSRLHAFSKAANCYTMPTDRYPPTWSMAATPPKCNPNQRK